MTLTPPLPIGSLYRTFRVTDSLSLPELNCSLTIFEDNISGATVMWIHADDPQNAFCLSFQTLPSSSNGVAHILEHTVLCGSKKYPVKDPFFSMSRRSLNTFMNAFTGSDFTCYPAASQIEQDFYNLLDVYTDAVFYPNLTYFSFLQEGHRFEFKEPENPKSPLIYKGIVYNEMKGALSSGHARLNEEISRLLFPGLPYGFNSGGDPKEIPTLTYEELLDFHRTFYHPGRCLFYFYGNLPIEKNLDFLADKVLKDIQRPAKLPPIPRQVRYKEPVKEVSYYPISSHESVEKKTLVSFSWLTCHILNQKEVLALHILLIMLMDNDASPLKRALLDTGLCTQATAIIDTDTSEIPISITLTGCEPDFTDKLESALISSLKRISEETFSSDLIERALHQMELNRLEITEEGLPHGLGLFMRSGLLKQHGGRPEEALKIHTLFDILKKDLKENPRRFNEMLEYHFLNNPHRVTITMVPDPELSSIEEKEERDTLDVIQSNMNPEECQALISQTKELSVFQKKEEEVDLSDCLPKIALSNVPLKPRYFPLERKNLCGTAAYHHDTFTNGLTYATFSFDLPQLKLEELPFLRLLVTLLPQIGTKSLSYGQVLEDMQRYTGGISAALNLNQQALCSDDFTPSLTIHGKALDRNAVKLFSLMTSLSQELDFEDKVRIKEVILKHDTAIRTQLSQRALRYATSFGGRSLSEPNLVSSYCFGLDYVWFLKKMVDNLDQHIDLILNTLKGLSLRIFDQAPDIIVTSCLESWQNLEKNTMTTWEGHSKRNIFWKMTEKLPEDFSQARSIASAVAFNAKVIPTVSFIHEDAAPLCLASFILDNQTLHPKIREQGGAYGGGSTASASSATFTFYSYRDPHIFSTFEAFDESVSDLLEDGITDDELEEAKLEMVQGLDAPLSPGSRGDLSYAWLQEGKTYEMRCRFREDILSMTQEKIYRAVKNHLTKPVPLITMAGLELIERENEKRKEEGLPPLPVMPIES